MPPTSLLSGKIALVTGGGRGIGKAITRSFVENAATVVIASRKREVLDATAGELNALGFSGKVVPRECHVGRKDQLEGLVKGIEETVGPIDILVNNSATNIGQGPALDVTDEMLDRIFEVNVKAALRLVRLTVPGMIERKGGAVLNIVSIGGLQPLPGSFLYCASKAALIMMTRGWAREFGPANVRVNAIAPGLIQTDFSAYHWQDDKRREEIMGTQSLRKLGQPEDVSGLALFLASDAASFITGQTYVVDGGSIG